jgi:2-keto-4-pentenoate hydratase/2-oxohepta-3-ene-1,7-dioic acid hydratase in catechol pathway
MKIARIAGQDGAVWASIDTDRGTARPFPGSITEWGPGVAARGGDGAPQGGPEIDFDPTSLLVPVEPTSKVVCLGATYAKHVAGLGREMPERPAGFWKPYSALLEQGGEIEYPEITDALDFEAEIVIVMGASRVDRAVPAHSILGYTVGNDVSARDLQFGGSITGMDMFSAKSFDRSSGIGPWIVTRDEFGDGHPDLELRLTVDGEIRQLDRTSSMVWPVDELVVFADRRTGLHAGDVLFTGTTHGIGHEDGRYLTPGQQVDVTIEGIGTLRNPVGPRRGR